MLQHKNRISTEQMRYRIPHVRNRFWSVHKSIIFLCLILLLILITFLSAFLSVRASALSGSRFALLFFCEIGDPENIPVVADKLKYHHEVFFAKNDDAFISHDDNHTYDLSMFGEKVNTYFQKIYDSSLFALLFSPERSIYIKITYGSIDATPTEKFSCNEAVDAVKNYFATVFYSA